MRNECMALVNLEDKNINQLTNARPVASVPLGARYRVIDFTLSNIINSGITNVGVFAKEKYRSLTDHLGSGKDWDLSRKTGGLFIFSPENTKNRNKYTYKSGDIYSILSNIDYIEKSEEEYILVAPAHVICNIDYSKAIEAHKKSNKDITIIYKNIDNADQDFELGTTLSIEEGKVVNLGSNVGAEKEANISMKTYIMKRTDFIDYIYSCVNKGNYSYIEDFIVSSLNELEIGAYEHKGYLKCISNVKSYFEMSKDLLNEEVAEELLYSGRKIFTREQNQAPTIYADSSDVKNSFIATGCTIEGTVKNSIIFRKVHVKKGAVIENAIIMQGCTIDENAELNNVILDKYVYTSQGKQITGDEDYPIVVEKSISI